MADERIQVTCYVVKETHTGWGVLPRTRLRRSRELVWLVKNGTITKEPSNTRTAVFWIPKIEAADLGLISLV